jgi:hypothetical protein
LKFKKVKDRGDSKVKDRGEGWKWKAGLKDLCLSSLALSLYASITCVCMGSMLVSERPTHRAVLIAAGVQEPETEVGGDEDKEEPTHPAVEGHDALPRQAEDHLPRRVREFEKVSVSENRDVWLGCGLGVIGGS